MTRQTAATIENHFLLLFACMMNFLVVTWHIDRDTCITLIGRPVSFAKVSRMCLVGFGVCKEWHKELYKTELYKTVSTLDRGLEVHPSIMAVSGLSPDQRPTWESRAVLPWWLCVDLASLSPLDHPLPCNPLKGRPRGHHSLNLRQFIHQW